MGVELGLVRARRRAVEVGKEVGRGALGQCVGLVLALPRTAQQVVDQRLGVHLLLDIERRGVDDEVAPVLLILAAPHELGVEVGVARVADRPRAFLLFLDKGLLLGGGDVPALGLVVLQVSTVFEVGALAMARYGA